VPLDVLIPLGSGSKWQNNELRYCLRSIEKFASSFDRIFVIGDDPGFLSDQVQFRKVAEPPINKQARIANKIFWAFQQTDISNDAALFNDDYVLSAPVDLSKIRAGQRGGLRAAAERQGDASYKTCLQLTAEALEAVNLPALHYDLHAPMIIAGDRFLALKPWWIESANSTHGYVVKSVYANNVLPFVGPHVRDCKLRSQLITDIDSFVNGRAWFSYSDAALTPLLKGWLIARFPEKSRFEK
jgi:hypothetical protein